MIVDVGEERKTYQEIADWLKRLGFKTSKSAVGRYAKYLYSTGYYEEQIRERLRLDSPGNEEPYIKKQRLCELLNQILDLFDFKDS